jgi:hypothetical protein
MEMFNLYKMHQIIIILKKELKIEFLRLKKKNN